MAKVKLQYYENLDGLRGIAAFAVIVFHFFGTHGRPLTTDVQDLGVFTRFTDFLQHGVTFFFVLSGFVITRILLNTREDNDYFSRFYKRRALRILPLYYLYLILQNYMAPWILTGQVDQNYSNHAVQYVYLQNMTWLTGWQGSGPPHFWSLAVEEHFYLIWPLVIFLIPTKYIKPTTIFLLVASLPIKYLFFENGIDIYKNTFSRYDSIMVGCLIAIFEKEFNYKFKSISKKTFLAALGIMVLAGALIYTFRNELVVLKAISMHLILSLVFGMVIYFLLTIKDKNVINNLLVNKPMQYFGKISYGLYVWHWAAISLAASWHFENYLLNLLLVFTITIAISHISFFYFEKWFFRFK